MIDMVPKAISLTLVNHSKENLQRELLQELYKPEVLDDLLKESEFVVSRRKEVRSMVEALNKAEEYVHKYFHLHCLVILIDFFLQDCGRRLICLWMNGIIGFGYTFIFFVTTFDTSIIYLLHGSSLCSSELCGNCQQ